MLAAEGEGYVPPSIIDFFPPAILFEGTPFELNRIMLIRILMTVLLCVAFLLYARSARVVSGRALGTAELALDFVRKNIAEEILGTRDGRRFLPLIASIFFAVLAMNITGIIPLMNISPNANIGFPLVMAVVTYVTFIVAGIRAQGTGQYFKSQLVPPGAPLPVYVLLTPIEFISTFVLRPATLTVRLFANMLAGHLLLVLFFGATSYLLFSSSGVLPVLGIVTLVFGFAFTLFEILVAVLQAYIFALLAAVYIQTSVTAEH